MKLDKALSVANAVLSSIPGDGQKTNLGLLLLALPKLLAFIPGLQFLAVPGVVDAIGAAVLAVGVAHKAVKTEIEKR